MTMNSHDIPEGRANVFSRIQLVKLWSCSDRAAGLTLSDFRAGPSGDPCIILSLFGEPAGYWRSHDSAEITTFIGETDARDYDTFLTLREARRLQEQLNHGIKPK